MIYDNIIMAGSSPDHVGGQGEYSERASKIENLDVVEDEKRHVAGQRYRLTHGRMVGGGLHPVKLERRMAGKAK
jgi:hypothetical protein